MTEPIASSTLALLYLAQGHRARASATLNEVLELEPLNGYALALRERLRRRPQPSVSIRFVGSSAAGIDIGAGELELRWSIPPELIASLGPERRIDIVIATATPTTTAMGSDGSLRYTSIPCLDRSATQRVAIPLGPASAAVALIASAPSGSRPLEFLAIAEPLSW